MTNVGTPVSITTVTYETRLVSSDQRYVYPYRFPADEDTKERKAKPQSAPDKLCYTQRPASWRHITSCLKTKGQRSHVCTCHVDTNGELKDVEVSLGSAVHCKLSSCSCFPTFFFPWVCLFLFCAFIFVCLLSFCFSSFLSKSVTSHPVRFDLLL